MSNFPLYTTLKKNICKKDLTIQQKNDLVNKILSLESEQHELIYVLIKCYFLEKDKEQNVILPYKGKIIKENIEFNLTDLPIELRQILFKFVTIHEQKIKEESKIEE